MDKSGRKAIEDLLSAACDGQLSKDEQFSLDDLLRTDADARAMWLSFSRLHSELLVQLAADHILEKSINTIRELESHSVGSVDSLGGVGGTSPLLNQPSLTHSPQKRPEVSKPLSAPPFAWFGVSTAYRAAAAALLVSAVYYHFSDDWLRDDLQPQGSVAIAQNERMSVGVVSTAVNCTWLESSGITPTINRTIVGGEEFALLEGMAQLRLANGVQLQIAGPASLVVASESSIMLRYGALVGKLTSVEGGLEIAIPSGRLRIDGGEFGVKVAGEITEVHTFSGQVKATLSPFSAMSFQQDSFGPSFLPDIPDYQVVEEGSAIRLETKQGALHLERQFKADRNGFAMMIPMDGPLHIPAAYVAAVKASEPLGYWRFDRSASNTVLNEQSSSYPLEVEGEVSFSGHGENNFVDFASGNSNGFLLCRKPLEELTGQGNYTVECWFKPSHFHHGMVVGLIDKPESDPHAGVIIELQPGLYDPNPLSGRIRFLHRSPPGGGLDVGTSCWSERRYRLRHWQHVAAVKEGSELRFYVNGKLSGRETENTPLVGGLHVVCGQHPLRGGIRQFVGQLDELAVYSRALGQEELIKHFNAAPQTENSSFSGSEETTMIQTDCDSDILSLASLVF